jgi:hypothetical protein
MCFKPFKPKGENEHDNQSKECMRVMIQWRKRLLVFLWMQWDSLFHILFNVTPIDPENKLLFSRLRTYRGKTIHLQDGEEIRSGDRVIELHFNNRMLFDMVKESGSVIHLAVGMIRGVRKILPLLAVQIFQNPNLGSVKGLYGITMIHQGTSKLGFTVDDLQAGAFNKLTRIYLRLLLFAMHPKGKGVTVQKGNRLTPKIVAMSVKELKHRYF